MDLFREAMKKYYEEQNDKRSEEELCRNAVAACKHEITETIDYQVVCIECHLILQERILTFEYNKRYSRQSRKCTPHCTKRYFIKLLNKLSEVTSSLNLNVSYWVLISDFEEQETVLKEVLQDEGKRKNSLSVHYKLHKLLQRHGISTNDSLKLPKCHKTITEHDRIMKEVWSRLDWDWIETF